MTKKRILNDVLVTIAIICPFLFFYGIFGLFLGEGPIDKPWKVFTISVALPCFLLAGPVGCLTTLFLFLKNRRSIIGNPLLSVGCATLFTANVYVLLPVVREVAFRLTRPKPVPSAAQLQLDQNLANGRHVEWDQTHKDRNRELQTKFPLAQAEFHLAYKQRDAEAISVKFNEFLNVMKEYEDAFRVNDFSFACNIITIISDEVFCDISEEQAISMLDDAIPVCQKILFNVKVEYGENGPRKSLVKLKLEKRLLEMRRMVESGDDDGVKRSVDEVLTLAASDKDVASETSSLAYCVARKYPEYGVKLFDVAIAANKDKRPEPEHKQYVKNMEDYKSKLEERLEEQSAETSENGA